MEGNDYISGSFELPLLDGRKMFGPVITFQGGNGGVNKSIWQ